MVSNAVFELPWICAFLPGLGKRGTSQKNSRSNW